MMDFYPGDYVMCQYEGDAAWYPAIFIGEGRTLITTDVGTNIILEKPILKMLHVGGDYYPIQNEHKNIKVIMEAGERVTLDDFRATHEVKMSYSVPVYGTSEISRLTGE